MLTIPTASISIRLLNKMRKSSMGGWASFARNTNILFISQRSGVCCKTPRNATFGIQILYLHPPAVHDGGVMLSILLLAKFNERLLGPAPFTASLSLFGWRVSCVTPALALTLSLENLFFFRTL